MKKSKQFKQAKRLRFDETMITVGLFALVGGYFVFTSYAAQKSNTTKPGIIQLNALKKNGIYYNVSLKKGLRYCFDDPQPRAKAVVYEQSKLSESKRLVGGCFSVEKNYKNILMGITGVERNSALTITKR